MSKLEQVSRPEKTLLYESAAEPCMVPGWRCKTCKAMYHIEDAARVCCAVDAPCHKGCGERVTVQGRYMACPACCRKSEDERWAKLKKADWDGETPLCVYGDDRYFFDVEALANWVDEANYDRKEEGLPPLHVEDLRLQLCEVAKPRVFEANDFWSDDLPEDEDLDSDEIDTIVNEWAEANIRTMYYPSGNGVTTESLREHLQGMLEYEE